MTQIDSTATPQPSSVPTISVLMPVYNGEAFLKESIDSVLGQTMQDFEFIIVDDGSTDQTQAILQAHASRDTRIRILVKENSGISETLNAGLSLAKGEWVARLDADDLMLPMRLAEQFAFVSGQPDLVAAGSYYEIINSRGRAAGTAYPLPRTRDELEALFANRQAITFTHPTMIYRREMALAVGGYRKSFEPCEDVDLFARMFAQNGLILIQPLVLTRYRVHPGSISTSKVLEQFYMLRFIYHNFYAVRKGDPAISLDDYLRSRRRLHRRVHDSSSLISERFYRRSTAAMVEGNLPKALVYLTVASALRPYKSIRRGLRNLGDKARLAKT